MPPPTSIMAGGRRFQGAVERPEMPRMDPSTFIALVALAFAIGSAWWMYVKRGRIRATKPPHFALLHNGTVFFIRVPLAIRNTGGRTLVVQDMRLWLPESPQVLAIPWRRTVETLLPVSTEPTRDPVPFAVKGHDAVASVAEFGPPFPGFNLHSPNPLLRVEVMLADRLEWETMMNFRLELPVDEVDLDKYQRYSNLNFKDDIYTIERINQATSRLIEHLSNGGDTPQNIEITDDLHD